MQALTLAWLAPIGRSRTMMTRCQVTKLPDYTFSIDEKVWLQGPELHGTVQAVMFSRDGVEYQVAYWDDAVRCVTWLPRTELTRVEVPRSIQVSE